MNTNYDYEMNEQLNTEKFISGHLNSKSKSFKYLEQETKRIQKKESMIAQLPKKMRKSLNIITQKKTVSPKKTNDAHKSTRKLNVKVHNNDFISDIEQFEYGCVDAQDETRFLEWEESNALIMREPDKLFDSYSDIESVSDFYDEEDAEFDQEWTAKYNAYFTRHMDEITEELVERGVLRTDVEIYDMGDILDSYAYSDEDSDTDSDPEWTSKYNAYFTKHMDEITEDLIEKGIIQPDNYDYYEEPLMLTDAQLESLQNFILS
jgi:hypothetical protein